MIVSRTISTTDPLPHTEPASPPSVSLDSTVPDVEAPMPIVLSFDVEEHHRIEAAAGLTVAEELCVDYANRMERTTERILDLLAQHNIKATFYLVGEIARSHPQLIREIASEGHEIGSHGWVHRRVHTFTPETFRKDVALSKAALEEVSGTEVVGYRAPTFSIMRSTAWAIDILAECGMSYDSSIFPVRHDRYGVPDAPRTPFIVERSEHRLLELPPTTWRVLGQNLPVAGGGYFRLFPQTMLHAGLSQLSKQSGALGMLYFHPWEFDPEQPRLPLGRLSQFRTYVGIRKSEARLERLLVRYRGRFAKAADVAARLLATPDKLPRYRFV